MKTLIAIPRQKPGLLPKLPGSRHVHAVYLGCWSHAETFPPIWRQGKPSESQISNILRRLIRQSNANDVTSPWRDTARNSPSQAKVHGLRSAIRTTSGASLGRSLRGWKSVCQSTWGKWKQFAHLSRVPYLKKIWEDHLVGWTTVTNKTLGKFYTSLTSWKTLFLKTQNPQSWQILMADMPDQCLLDKEVLFQKHGNPSTRN